MKSFGVFMFVTIQEFSYMFLMSWKHCNIILMVEKTVSNWSSNSSCSTENNARFHRVYIYIVLRTRRHKYPRARCGCIPGKERRIFYAFWIDLAISYQSKPLEITTPIKRPLYHVLLIGKRLACDNSCQSYLAEATSDGALMRMFKATYLLEKTGKKWIKI